MMKGIYTLWMWGALVLLMGSSCNDWLDVKPDNKVLEEDLLKDEKGFNTALNGIYLSMAEKDLYGKELSCGYIEAIAQMYNISQPATGNFNEYMPFTQYKYSDKHVKPYFDRTWTALYKLVANCNNLLEQAMLKKELFSSEGNYNSYISELYALRAFLQFDAFRLWGPRYSEDTKDIKCIPYYKERVALPESLTTAEKVVQHVLADLHIADSLAPRGVKTYRTLNICKHAIRLLQARVYLYTGEKELAYKVCMDLLADNIRVTYPFVSQIDIQQAENPDRLFYDEQVFMLENSKRNELYEKMFDYMLGEVDFLAPQAETITKLFPDHNDYRYYWWKVNPGNGKGISFMKFAKISANGQPRERGQSLLKISELFLILAECAPEEDMRLFYLNELRVGRGYQNGAITDAEQKDWQTTLQQEYLREFYGEGQYFFYLKRNNISSVPAGTGNGNISMGNAQYVIPLPDSEALYQ